MSQCLSAFLRRRTGTNPGGLLQTTSRLNASRHSSDVGPRTRHVPMHCDSGLNASRHSSDVGPPAEAPVPAAPIVSQCLSAFLRRRTQPWGPNVGGTLVSMPLGIPPTSDPRYWYEEKVEVIRLNASRHSSDVGPDIVLAEKRLHDLVSMPLGIPPTSDPIHPHPTIQTDFVSMPLGIPPTSDLFVDRAFDLRHKSQCLSAFLRRRTVYVAGSRGSYLRLNASRHSSDVGPGGAFSDRSSNTSSQCLSAFLRRRTKERSPNHGRRRRLNASRHSSDVGPTPTDW